jgi:hypothetical protein
MVTLDIRYEDIAFREEKGVGGETVIPAGKCRFLRDDKQEVAVPRA